MFNVSGGVNTALASTEGLYDSYKKRDKIGMVISAISILSGLATASGNPIGIAISLGLNLLKTMFAIGKKGAQKPAETESEKMEKIIKKALSEYRETSLRAEWLGYERSSDIFSENVKFLSNFDEKIKDFTSKYDSLGLKEPEIKRSVFDIVMSKFYTEHMSSTVLLGKIEHEITEQCDEDVVKNEVKKLRSFFKSIKSFFIKEKNPTISEQEDKEDYAKKCLGLYELYGKINYYRQTKLLNDLDTVIDILDKKYNTKNLNDIDKTLSDLKLKAFSLELLIINVIKQVNENDKKVYKPLADAFKNVKMRFLINYYHTHSKKYEYLNKYMEKLDLEQDRLKEVMFCTKEALIGSCTLEAKMEESNFKYRSAFVPKDKTLEVFYKGTDGGSLKIFGPGTMPNMFYNIKDDEKTNPIKKHEIKDYKRNSATSRFVKICRFPKQEEGSTLEPLHKAVCTDREFKLEELKKNNNGLSVKTDDLHCGSNKCFGGTPIAVSTEEIDVAFTAHKKIIEKKETMTVTWGPFFGPIKMEKGCGSIFWDELRFYRYKSSKLQEAEQNAFNEAQHPGFKIEPDIELFKKTDIIDKSYFLKICKETSLKGFCQEIPLVKGQANNIIIDLKHIGIAFKKGTSVKTVNLPKKISRDTSKGKYSSKIHAENDECIWDEQREKDGTMIERINLLRSMKIPDGITIELYNEYAKVGGEAAGDMFGPYKGPLAVDRVDGNGAIGEKTIKAIKIIEY